MRRTHDSALPSHVSISAPGYDVGMTAHIQAFDFEDFLFIFLLFPFNSHTYTQLILKHLLSKIPFCQGFLPQV
jgi:hypothetical protein